MIAPLRWIVRLEYVDDTTAYFEHEGSGFSVHIPRSDWIDADRPGTLTITVEEGEQL
jgi:hypothetical protein